MHLKESMHLTIKVLKGVCIYMYMYMIYHLVPPVKLKRIISLNQN